MYTLPNSTAETNSTHSHSGQTLLSTFAKGKDATYALTALMKCQMSLIG